MKLDATTIVLAVVMLVAGGLVGHFIWTPGPSVPLPPSVIIHSDSTTIDSLQWIVSGISSELVAEKGRSRSLEQFVGEAAEAESFWINVAHKLNHAVVERDSLLALALRGDTTLTRADTAVVEAGDSSWTFITPRKLRAEISLDLMSRTFGVDLRVSPSTVYFGVLDTVRVVEVTKKLSLWWEALPVSSGILYAVAVYEKSTLPFYIATALLVVDILVRVW